MKKTKLTRSLLAAFSIVALTAVVYGCSSSGEDAANDRADQAEMQVTMLQGQINALRAQLGLAPADDLSDSITDLQDQVDDLRQQIADAAKAAADAAEKARLAEMAATAAKLYAGISAQMGAIAADGTGTAATDRDAAYNTAGTAILVSIGDGTNAPTALTLMEDEDTMVAKNHGWAGKRYADPAGGDMVEAMVYSNVADPTQGKKFGGATANDEFEYALTDGALTNAQLTAAASGTTPAAASRIVLTGVTRTAGTETFELPDPNPTGISVITVPGSFHGVSGTYSCATTAGTACTAAVAAKGFTLAGGTAGWTFTPSDANARVMDAEDTAYASYGWWLHKTENGQTFTASAFVDEMGTVEAASGLDTLNGSATYMGGAAGKYALASSTGGTNDAGHFTARATLEANFTDNEITGTIDMFMGADGMARDWSVELMRSSVSPAGVIAGDPDTAGNTDAQMTEWTIGGTAAAAAGSWTGSLRNNGTDGVPQVATGTFYSEYGTAGKMVGGFGANEQ